MKGDVTGKEDLPEHGVTTVFVNLPNTKIELLYPYGDKSPIAGFLAKNKKGGIHHICIEVDNIKAAMADCEAKGIRLLNKGKELCLAPTNHLILVRIFACWCEF